MFKVRVIPCLDVKDGRVVKGINFVNLRDAGDPVEAAIAYDAAGADELTFLDITASHENRGTILDVVQRTAEACFMPVTVGGGVRTVEDIRALLRAGADKVSINTAAVNNRAFVKEAAEKFGDQCIVVAIDAKSVSQPGEPDRWEIFTHGGRNRTGIDAIDYAREVASLGAGEILLTSMDRDGTRTGFDIPLTRAIADAVSVPVIASGGVGNLDHLVEGIRDGHATAVLAASIFHFGEYSVQQAKQHMAKAGLPVQAGRLASPSHPHVQRALAAVADMRGLESRRPCCETPAGGAIAAPDGAARRARRSPRPPFPVTTITNFAPSACTRCRKREQRRMRFRLRHAVEVEPRIDLFMAARQFFLGAAVNRDRLRRGGTAASGSRASSAVATGFLDRFDFGFGLHRRRRCNNFGHAFQRAARNGLTERATPRHSASSSSVNERPRRPSLMRAVSPRLRFWPGRWHRNSRCAPIAAAALPQLFWRQALSLQVP